MILKGLIHGGFTALSIVRIRSATGKRVTIVSALRSTGYLDRTTIATIKENSGNGQGVYHKDITRFVYNPQYPNNQTFNTLVIPLQFEGTYGKTAHISGTDATPFNDSPKYSHLKRLIFEYTAKACIPGNNEGTLHTPKKPDQRVKAHTSGYAFRVRANHNHPATLTDTGFCSRSCQPSLKQILNTVPGEKSNHTLPAGLTYTAASNHSFHFGFEGYCRLIRVLPGGFAIAPMEKNALLFELDNVSLKTGIYGTFEKLYN